ncbi:MAG TPA: succinate--CoA ligase subunit alpha [Candidatus Eisenbacteria bacterium]|jgi:succinyl-CoA synthetase alpha subunit|nr:succinate--CoA ligase subunit alpha [Candidatus Eisenbacteria bacterium]
MSILVDRSSRVLVQGITGRDGSFHAKQMKEYGTRVVAGVTPGKGGTSVDGIPVFDSVEEAVAKTKADVSVIYVPAALAQDAIYEAVDAEVPLVVCITEGLPVRDMVEVAAYLRNRSTRLIGPNCPGLISPGQCKVGIMPGFIHAPGRIGLVSRSGTLTYEVVWQLTRAKMGQSTCIGIGGDPIIGTRFTDALALFEGDDRTDAVVLIGEIGGQDEEEAAALIESSMSKPVVAFIAGQTAPPGKRMGHAGAIVSGGSGTAQEKVARFERAGVPVAKVPSEIPRLIADALARRRPKLRVVVGQKAMKKAKTKKRAPAKKAKAAKRSAKRKS